jgi:hypothetical protein
MPEMSNNTEKLHNKQEEKTPKPVIVPPPKLNDSDACSLRIVNITMTRQIKFLLESNCRMIFN